MSAGDKRVVTTDALETLGTIHKKQEHRDAIHLAVEPVEAGQDLDPGDHIDVRDGIASYAAVGKGLGIVDPFLHRGPKKGQKFWFVMYPGRVHSLRHVWTHPAFPDQPGVIAEAEERPTPPRAIKKALDRAKAVIQEHADDLELDYEEMLDKARQWIAHGDYHIGGSEAEGHHIDEEFWQAWELVTGEEVPDDKRGNFISCSC